MVLQESSLRLCLAQRMCQFEVRASMAPGMRPNQVPAMVFHVVEHIARAVHLPLDCTPPSAAAPNVDVSWLADPAPSRGTYLPCLFEPCPLHTSGSRAALFSFFSHSGFRVSLSECGRRAEGLELHWRYFKEHAVSTIPRTGVPKNCFYFQTSQLFTTANIQLLNQLQLVGTNPRTGFAVQPCRTRYVFVISSVSVFHQ